MNIFISPDFIAYFHNLYPFGCSGKLFPDIKYKRQPVEANLKKGD